MIRFINIDNGRVYNGDMPHVHWFDGQQSVDLIYVQRLCVLADSNILEVNIPKNDVFTLLDVEKITPENEVIMDHVSYQDLANLRCNTIMSVGVPYDGYFVHMLYFSATSNTPMEARQSFYIGGEEFKIGADFYEEREELKLNLENMGVEIPESVQRAIYPSNVHEEAKDDILMNRKYKELLMDYMDILGTRGNYMSLINSLNWFEYGDLLTLKEFWRHDEWERTIYSDTALTQILSNKAKDMLVNFAKTTYIGIYCAMQKDKTTTDSEGNIVPEYEKETFPENVNGTDIYNASLDRSLPTSQEGPDILLQHGAGEVFITDYPGEYKQDEIDAGSNWVRSSQTSGGGVRFIGEGNPVLEAASHKWSRADMAIKMALLGNFYETYFMPIHLDLIHSTVEDIIYTNAIKIIPFGHLDREDYFYGLDDCICNVHSGDIFQLENVGVQAAKEVRFANLYKAGDTYDSHVIVGVADEVYAIKDDNDLKSFMLNNYTGVGVVVPFHFQMKVDAEDFVKHTKISFRDDFTNKWQSIDFYDIIPEGLENHTDGTHPGCGTQYVNFNLLFTKDQPYDLRFEFDTAGGLIFTKCINIEVVDNYRSTLRVYKVKPILGSVDPNTKDLDYAANDYMFTHYPAIVTPDDEPVNVEALTYSQFVPHVSENNENSENRIRLNHCIVIKNINGYTSLDELIKKCGLEEKIGSYITDRYYSMVRYRVADDGSGWKVDETKISYFILISKEYNTLVTPTPGIRKEVEDNFTAAQDSADGTPRFRVIRKDMIYIPQFHQLEPIDGDRLEDYMIKDETLCVIPDIKYLKRITECEWIFHNASTGRDITLDAVKEPNILPTTYENLPKGYYDIIFRYRLGDSVVQEVTLNSAFIQQ